jgi:hypothetical protein
MPTFSKWFLFLHISPPEPPRAEPCICTTSLIRDLLAYIWILRVELWLYLHWMYVSLNPVHVVTGHTITSITTILNSPGICMCGFYPILVAVIVNTTNLKSTKKINICYSCLLYCLCVDWLLYGLWDQASTAVVKPEATAKALPEKSYVIPPAGDISFISHGCLVY